MASNWTMLIVGLTAVVVLGVAVFVVRLRAIDRQLREHDMTIRLRESLAARHQDHETNDPGRG